MYAAVIDNIRLYYLVAVGGHNVGQGATQQVVANMSQMKRFVGVGA